MTLDEARQHIGGKVIYCPPGSEQPEEGVITSVTKYFVFVRYGSDRGSKATQPWRLDLLASTP